jgi:outer membrane protein TolC
MDLCNTPNDRIEILEKIVQFHKKCEEQVARRADEGRATRIDVEKAKLARLEAQIELVRENLKGQPTK